LRHSSITQQLLTRHFSSLHDLDRDHYLSIPEIEAIYGLHHPTHLTATGNAPSAALESKRKIIVDKVLDKLDTDKDGRISIEEFVRGGWEGLPSFVGWKGLGHHYGSEEE
jgi:Ca2+-binding EF-hand superfamily protein